MNRFIPLAVSAAALLATLTVTLPVAEAQPPVGAPRQCFYVTQMQGFRAEGMRTLYTRVGVRAIYRFDMAQDCHGLPFNSQSIIVAPVASGTICNPLDVDLTLSDTGERCIVKDIVRLTDAEAADLPNRDKP